MRQVVLHLVVLVLPGAASYFLASHRRPLHRRVGSTGGVWRSESIQQLGRREPSSRSYLGFGARPLKAAPEDPDDSDDIATRSSPVQAPTPPVTTLQPRRESAVAVPIRDVRTFMTPASAARTEPSGTPGATFQKEGAPPARRDDNDALQQLLVDARAMQPEQASSEPGTFTGRVGQSFRQVLSTVVTVDFFVVVFFLLWFLAGVASSTFLRNDAIQLAFNALFQPVVQPALGILMMAALADGLLPKPEEQEK